MSDVLSGIGDAVLYGILLVSFYLALRFFLSVLAERDILVTYRMEGAFKYIMKGNNLVKVLHKLPPDKTLDENYNVVDRADPTARDPQVTLLERFFGVQWVGFPPYRVDNYPFYWIRDIKPEDKEKQRLDPTKYIVHEEEEIVERTDITDYHLYEAVYAIYISNLETSDQIQIDLFGTITLRTRNAYKPVQLLKGQWFRKVRDAIKGTAADYVKSKTIEELRRDNFASKNSVTSTDRSDIEEAIVKISSTNGGTIDDTGMEVTSFNISGFEVTKSVVEEATEAQKLAELRGNASKATADANAYVIDKEGMAKAKVVEALVMSGGKSAIGADVEKTRELSEAIAKHKGTLVLNIGGSPAAQPTILIQEDQNTSAQPTQNPPTPTPTGTDPTNQTPST